MSTSKKLVMLLTPLLSVIVSCGTVQVHDIEACSDLASAGAECAHTYVTKRRAVSKAEWDHMRVGWFCMSPIDFSDTEDSLDELCKNNPGACSYVAEEQIQRAKKNFAPILRQAIELYKMEKAK